jgi:glycosyltransferase involved in cell wall biosynthesis
MRALSVNGRFLTQPMSGVQRYARELLTAFDALLSPDTGTVPVWHPGGALADPPDWQRLRPVPLAGPGGHLWEQFTLARAARGTRLISLCGSGPLWQADQLLVVHDANIWDAPESFAPRYRLFHAVMRPRLARRLHATATVSHAAAAALAPRLGVTEAQLAVIPNAAGHLAGIAPDTTILARHSLLPGGYYLALGNQSPNKNLARLAAAHAAARRDHPGLLPLVIAGGMAPGLAAATVTPRPGLIVLGRVTDAALRALYDNARAFLWPALSEGFGIPPLEAMALGLPVLSSQTSAMPEVLGDAPVWFDPRDTAAITAAILRFESLNETARAAMVARGYRRAAAYRWEDSAQKLMSLVA